MGRVIPFLVLLMHLVFGEGAWAGASLDAERLARLTERLCAAHQKVLARFRIPSPSAAWSDPEIRRSRVNAVLNHQNDLRAKKQVPLLSHDVSEIQLDRDRVPYVQAEPVDAFPDQPIAGTFLIIGDLLVRAEANDNFRLNHVYEFQGGRLSKYRSYAEWYLERFPGPELTLYRRMSQTEFRLWRERKFENLGSTMWSEGESVVHFSTDREFTTVGGSARIAIRVPRSVLLTWARQGKLWSGAIRNEDLVSEFVLPAREMGGLVASGQISFVP